MIALTLHLWQVLVRVKIEDIHEVSCGVKQPREGENPLGVGPESGVLAAHAKDEMMRVVPLDRADGNLQVLLLHDGKPRDVVCGQ